MTFNFAPWAIDGARTEASLSRITASVSTGGRSGVASPLDLRVLPLSPNGNGVRISSGAAAVQNWYQSDPTETYIVSNPATHVVPSSDMPAPRPTTGYYLVCAVVGDPKFNQEDHPFMPSTPLPPEDAVTYEYVRVVIVPCTSTTTRFEDLGYNYPAYALARLEIPPNTTTITDSMIVDLRELIAPRSKRDVLVVQPTQGNIAGGTVLTQWTDALPIVRVPIWATHATVVLTISGALHMDPETQGAIRVRLGNHLMGPNTAYVFDDSTGASGGERVNLVTAVSGPVGPMAGAPQGIVLEALKDPAYAGYLQSYFGQTHIYDVQFDERIR